MPKIYVKGHFFQKLLFGHRQTYIGSTVLLPGPLKYAFNIVPCVDLLSVLSCCDTTIQCGDCSANGLCIKTKTIGRGGRSVCD